MILFYILKSPKDTMKSILPGHPVQVFKGFSLCELHAMSCCGGAIAAAVACWCTRLVPRPDTVPSCHFFRALVHEADHRHGCRAWSWLLQGTGVGGATTWLAVRLGQGTGIAGTLGGACPLVLTSPTLEGELQNSIHQHWH